MSTLAVVLCSLHAYRSALHNFTRFPLCNLSSVKRALNKLMNSRLSASSRRYVRLSKEHKYNETGRHTSLNQFTNFDASFFFSKGSSQRWCNKMTETYRAGSNRAAHQTTSTALTLKLLKDVTYSWDRVTVKYNLKNVVFWNATAYS